MLRKYSGPRQRRELLRRGQRLEHKHVEAERARANELALLLAEQAAKAALGGHVDEARQCFAKATEGTTEMKILQLALAFYFRTGDLSVAERIVERCLAISGRDLDSEDSAEAYGNLGLIYQRRGDLERAAEIHQDVLNAADRLGFHKCMADQYSRLGVIFYKRGELDHAEEMHKKALAIEVTLGRPDGLARQYCNLGLIYEKKGQLEEAETLHRKSLEIDEEQGWQEGVASQYANLGVIYEMKGELERAEEMHQRALATEKMLGRQGRNRSPVLQSRLIYEKKGQLDRAEEMQRKALLVCEMLGYPEGVTVASGNLGVIHPETRQLRLRPKKCSREHWPVCCDGSSRRYLPNRTFTWVRSLRSEGEMGRLVSCG
jgi:tetratricopeptide (TPR) repeat protein